MPAGNHRRTGDQPGLAIRAIGRHTRIGRGKMGLEPFRRLLADPRFQQTPMYLETPKGEEDGEDLDAVNLRVLRSLEAGTGSSPVTP